MKILLDECMPLDFRHHLGGHNIHTAEWAGFRGLKNGHLLSEAETAGYDVLLTVDQGIPRQQNLSNRKISILVIRARTSQIEDLLPAVENILRALQTIGPGEVAVISAQ